MAAAPVDLLQQRDDISRIDFNPSATTTRRHTMPFGAEVQPDGSVRFRLYGPAAEQVSLELDSREEPLALTRNEKGWHELITREAHIGSRYRFILPDGLRVPDPASRFQPADVHGPSEVIAPGSYLWHDGQWEGRPWREAVVYELHLGTFTPDGTFLAAIEKLGHLVSLGVTVIEVMPVADFPGKRGWGYDGVLLYAPDSTYGRPEDFKAFIEAAHHLGLSVLLDVVYNHFGPDGNYISSYYKELFNPEHHTSWGASVNYDGPNSEGAREFIIHNALYWIEEFHLDGLRLDAVHAIVDVGNLHLLDELSDRLHALPLRRPLHLVLENENNQAERLVRDGGRPLHYTAQWNDDMHHVLHTAATHEDAGYYKDYCGHTHLLGRALAEGFIFEDTAPAARCSEPAQRAITLPPEAYVSFIQNHDQIGNRAFGERMNAIALPEAVRALAATYLLSPQTPMIFMGEEWCASQPFPYFCDFDGELGDKVREGRRNEFSQSPGFEDPAQRDRIPDPQAESTFQSAKLNWNDLSESTSAEHLDWYRRMLGVRHDVMLPLFERLNDNRGHFDVKGPGALVVHWKLRGGELRLYANLCDQSKPRFPNVEGRVLWQEGPGVQDEVAQPWSVIWSLVE